MAGLPPGSTRCRWTEPQGLDSEAGHGQACRGMARSGKVRILGWDWVRFGLVSSGQVRPGKVRIPRFGKAGHGIVWILWSGVVCYGLLCWGLVRIMRCC